MSQIVPEPPVTGQDTVLRVAFDGSVFPKAAVLRACYGLAAEADFSVTTVEGQLVVEMAGLAETSRDSAARRLRELVVDYAIRDDVERRTAELRDLVWRTAFAHAGGRG